MGIQSLLIVEFLKAIARNINTEWVIALYMKIEPKIYPPVPFLRLVIYFI